MIWASHTKIVWVIRRDLPNMAGAAPAGPGAKILGSAAECTEANEDIRRHKLVDAITQLYNGTVTPPLVMSKCGIPRATAQRYLKGMPADLPLDSDSSRCVERAAIDLVYTDRSSFGRVPYTDHERTEALFEVATGDMKGPQASATYGIPVNTLTADLIRLRTTLKLATNADMRKFSTNAENKLVVRASCDSLPRPEKGAPRFLDRDTQELLYNFSKKHDQAGHGWDRRMMTSKSGALVRSMGEDLLETAETDRQRSQAQRMIGAKCGREWINLNLGENGFTKKSNLSLKRAAAANPVLDHIMRMEMEAVYDQHFEAKILPARRPSANQVWNGDEIGWDPNGKARSTFSGRREPGERGFRHVTGERAPFWATMFFFTRADGDRPVPPMIVHQGGSDSEMPASVALYLPEDWGIHCTASGYMDREGSRVLCELFCRYSGASPTNPQYLYWDAHDSHWDPEVLDYFADPTGCRATPAPHRRSGTRASVWACGASGGQLLGVRIGWRRRCEPESRRSFGCRMIQRPGLHVHLYLGLYLQPCM